MPLAHSLNRIVTLYAPERTTGTGLKQTTAYASRGTVRAAYRPARPFQTAQFGGALQSGAATLVIRRPVVSGGVEVVPDVGWRATMTEAGTTRTMHVDGVVDGEATRGKARPSARTWELTVTDVRVPA